MHRRVLLTVLSLLALVGCGDKQPTAQEQVRSAVTRFGEASAKKDYQAICDDLITPALVKGVQEAGLPCELAFQKGLGDVRAPTLKVLSVDVRGDRASARVATGAAGQAPSNDVLRLERAGGGWRIASLAG